LIAGTGTGGILTCIYLLPGPDNLKALKEAGEIDAAKFDKELTQIAGMLIQNK